MKKILIITLIFVFFNNGKILSQPKNDATEIILNKKVFEIEKVLYEYSLTTNKMVQHYYTNKGVLYDSTTFLVYKLKRKKIQGNSNELIWVYMDLYSTPLKHKKIDATGDFALSIKNKTCYIITYRFNYLTIWSTKYDTIVNDPPEKEFAPIKIPTEQEMRRCLDSANREDHRNLIAPSINVLIRAEALEFSNVKADFNNDTLIIIGESKEFGVKFGYDTCGRIWKELEVYRFLNPINPTDSVRRMEIIKNPNFPIP